VVFTRRPVCDKPFRIAPELLGRPLAHPLRRICAMALDLVVAFLLALPTYGSLLYLVTDAQVPGFPDRFNRVFQPDVENRGELFHECAIDMVILMGRRVPDKLPAEFLELAQRADREALSPMLVDYSWNASPDHDISSFDTCNKHIVFGRDGIFGPLASSLTWFSTMLLYFTLVTWLFKGRTFGKWVLGIRIFALNGKPISLWRSFGRTGGYTASLSTLGLGFFQTLWDPNRQSAHDQLAGTVVVHVRGKLA